MTIQTTRCLSFLCAWLALSFTGCDDEECPVPDTGADGDADSDADGDADADADEPPVVCTVPEVECAEGEHGEYGLCRADADEVAIAGGTFEMGAPTGTEFPAHEVTVSDFTIDRTEVTNELFRACVDAGCCEPPTYDGSYSGREPYFGNDRFDNYPVIFVTWDHAREYCEGAGKRLPTEAQWEFAARGTEGRPYPWGADPPGRRLANYSNGVDGDTQSVGTFDDGATPLGLVDMAGNVWEWVGDWYSLSYYEESPADDPPGPQNGAARVVRGGSFSSAEAQLYSFYRTSYLPTESYSNVGFRCAR